jgi:hypothetical protein
VTASASHVPAATSRSAPASADASERAVSGTTAGATTDDATKAWLEERFRAVAADGVYCAHQPIYGFRTGPSERGSLRKYAITLATMRALARLDFGTFVDVGGAEGYKAALVRHLFGADVTACDLAEEACRRSREIYGIAARQVDTHSLPFADGSFDVVMSSETLEHVTDIHAAAAELLRIARRAVVITVPRESQRKIDRVRRRGEPHGHLHALTMKSFDWMRDTGCSIHVDVALSPLTAVPFVLADGQPIRGPNERRPVVRAFNALTPLMRAVAGKHLSAALIAADLLLARCGGYADMVFTVTKPGCERLAAPRRRVRARDVIDFAVPLHRPFASR